LVGFGAVVCVEEKLCVLQPAVSFSDIFFDLASNYILVLFLVLDFAKGFGLAICFVAVLRIFNLCFILVLNCLVLLFVKIFLSKVGQMATVDRIEGLV
jgi:hypothetical protein